MIDALANPPLRAGTDSIKWGRYDPDVLPLWVADMDFPVPPVVAEAIRERAEHPIFGYCVASDRLKAAIVADMAARYGWAITPDDIVMLTGVVPGFNLALKALLKPGEGVTVQPPVYPPILAAPAAWGLARHDVGLAPNGAGGWAHDPAALDAAFARSRAFLFCNPHNPTGKVFTRAELEAIAASAERHDVLLLSDEIHCGLVFEGHAHIPIAALSPRIAARTVTFMSAGKTFNIAGLKTAFAIVQNPALREAMEAARAGLADTGNMFGLDATRAAYEAGEPWRRQLVATLAANRDRLLARVAREMPGVGVLAPEGTYLAWLDCRGLGWNEDPRAVFLARGRVALNPGPSFGPGGEGHVRLNFGCSTPRSTAWPRPSGADEATRPRARRGHTPGRGHPRLRPRPPRGIHPPAPEGHSLR